MTIKLITGDCRDILKTLPDESVHCVVTSPPYWGLRDYGVAGQLGLEQSLGEHVQTMVEVFREVRRVLRKDGTLWLNYGDSYAASVNGRSAADTKALGEDDRTFRDKPFSTIGPVFRAGSGRADGIVDDRNQRNRNGLAGFDSGYLKPKDLCGIPWRVAFALQEDGWWLRQDIIWSKPNPMPESVRDRCTKAHEYLFLMAKSERYYFDQEAISEPAIGQNHHDLTGTSYQAPGQPMQTGSRYKMPDGWDTGSGAHGKFHRNGRERGKTWEERKAMGFRGDTKHPTSDAIQAGLKIPSFATAPFGRNKRSVWEVATAPFSEAHFATFPPALIEPCILAGCPKDGTVLDPFGGAGTTALVADRLQRNAILIELNPAYVEIARKRIDGDAPLFTQVETDAGRPRVGSEERQ